MSAFVHDTAMYACRPDHGLCRRVHSTSRRSLSVRCTFVVGEGVAVPPCLLRRRACHAQLDIRRSVSRLQAPLKHERGRASDSEDGQPRVRGCASGVGACTRRGAASTVTCPLSGPVLSRATAAARRGRPSARSPPPPVVPVDDAGRRATRARLYG